MYSPPREIESARVTAAIHRAPGAAQYARPAPRPTDGAAMIMSGRIEPSSAIMRIISAGSSSTSRAIADETTVDASPIASERPTTPVDARRATATTTT